MRRLTSSFLMCVGVLMALLACENQSRASGEKTVEKRKVESRFATLATAKQMKVATYNVLNLFDSVHDEGKDDFTFLPKGYPGKQQACEKMSGGFYKTQCFETDWSEEKMNWKVNQVKKAIELSGDLPDLLGVEEIENANATGALSKALGFDGFLVTDSPDKRGIDVALLYRERVLQYLEHKEIVLQGEGFPPSFSTKPTRNILRALFAVRGSDTRFVVYVNHWPSQAAGPSKRVAVAEAVRKDIEEFFETRSREYHHVIVMGDFNTLPEEKPNAFHNVLQDPKWDNALIDAEDLSKLSKNPMQSRMPFHSYYYPRHNRWEKLDRILVSKGLRDGLGAEIKPESFRIVADDALLESFENTDSSSFYSGVKLPRVPMRYDFASENPDKLGYSDHLPVTVLIDL